MSPQDRPARRFDEPPAYEDLELRVEPHSPWRDMTPEEWDRAAEEWFREHRYPEGWPPPSYVKRRDPDIAARSHLGAIVIVAAIVGLALIAVALFVRGAS